MKPHEKIELIARCWRRTQQAKRSGPRNEKTPGDWELSNSQWATRIAENAGFHAASEAEADEREEEVLRDRFRLFIHRHTRKSE
jgi:hypothetical protein